MSLLTQERLSTGFWIGVGIAALVLLILLAPVLTPFAMAAILAYPLAPGVDWLQRRHVPRWAASLAMILLATLVIGGLVLILVPVLQREGAALRDQLPLLVDRLNASVAPRLNAWFGLKISFDPTLLRDLAASKVAGGEAGNTDFFATLLAQARSGGHFLLTLVSLMVLVPVVLFYLLLDGHEFKQRLENAIPRRWHGSAVAIWGEIDSLLAQFLRGQLTVMGLLAFYYSLALTVAGFQSALPIGIITGTLIFVPYVGYTLGLLLALTAALLQFDGWYGPLAVGVVYGLGQVLEGFFLTPQLVGGRIGLHPLAVIFALLAFGHLFGFFGVLAALPASAVLLVALRHLKQAYFASPFYKQP
ncbi:MAG: AI-2E family transporter [Acidobacteria bacterium]|nr:AI-2E family transporter [Acidobacteriota bacterium]